LGEGKAGLFPRTCLTLSGLVLAAPSGGLLGLSLYLLLSVSGGLFAAGILFALWQRKQQETSGTAI
jgi:hypothetical protein